MHAGPAPESTSAQGQEQDTHTAHGCVQVTQRSSPIVHTQFNSVSDSRDQPDECDNRIRTFSKKKKKKKKKNFFCLFARTFYKSLNHYQRFSQSKVRTRCHVILTFVLEECGARAVGSLVVLPAEVVQVVCILLTAAAVVLFSVWWFAMAEKVVTRQARKE